MGIVSLVTILLFDNQWNILEKLHVTKLHNFLSKILRTLYGAENIRSCGVSKCNYILYFDCFGADFG